MSLDLIPPSKRILTDKMYCEKSKCPICHQTVKKSDYLHKIFGDLANLSLASFTDSSYGKITNSQRNIN